jgi:hypothetical protein
MTIVDKAVRIEELERERDEIDALAHKYMDRFEQSEAKLAKAVEIGNKMAKSIRGNYYIPGVVAEWNAALAELKVEE